MQLRILCNSVAWRFQEADAMLHPTCISNCLRLKRERHVAITMVYSHKSRPEPLGLDPSPQPIRNDPSDTMRFEWFGLFRFGSAGARGTINQTLGDRHINCSTNQPTASFIHNSFALPHVGRERSTILYHRPYHKWNTI